MADGTDPERWVEPVPPPSVSPFAPHAETFRWRLEQGVPTHGPLYRLRGEAPPTTVVGRIPSTLEARDDREGTRP